jgi:hypothetical protein
MPVEISTHDDVEVEEEEWTDPMTPASIPPSLPPKSAPNGRDAVGLEAHSQPLPIHPHYSQPMRVPSSGKRHATSTSPPSGGSIRIKHSPVRNRQIPSNEVPFPSAATQQGAGGTPSLTAQRRTTRAAPKQVARSGQRCLPLSLNERGRRQ